MKFVVDTSGVAKGLRDYRSAVDGIFASLTKFEAHVEKTMKGVAKASANPQAIAAFKRAVGAFSKVDIDTSAARKLSALSAAMNGFKSPSPAQITNTRRFFSALGNLPDLSGAYKSIRALSDLNAAMSGFKSPAASHAKNLTAFANAVKGAVPALSGLSRIAGISGIANELATISIAMRNLKAPTSSQVTNLGNLALALRSFNFANLAGSGNFYAALGAISNFRAPSQSQIRNLQQFVNAVGQMRVPQNAGAVANALDKITAAATRAGGALGGLRSGMGGLGGSLGHVGGQARGASLQMMGLQNAFSATFQIGSLLRSLLGSLTIAELGRSYFEATNGALAFSAQMSVINKEAGFANAQLRYVNETANKFGIDSLAASQGFAKMSIAAHKSGVSVMGTRHIFEGMSTAMTVLGTSTAGQQDVWLALQQVMNKGYLSAEELNQQLNEKLPGAMDYATEYANSLGMSLEKGLKTKALDAAGVLAYMAKRMKEDFGPAVQEALKRPANQMTILRNNFRTLFQEIGAAGGNEAFASLLSNINDKMNPADIERYAQAIGGKLKSVVDDLSKAFNWLYTNWDSIKGPLATTLELVGKFMVVSGSLQIMRFLVSPLISAGTAAFTAAPLLWQVVYASRALAATNLAGYYTQLAKITDPRILAGTQALNVSLGRIAATRIGGAALSGLSSMGSLARAAAGPIAGLAAAIGVGLSAAWGIATQAAVDSNQKVVTVNYTAGEILTGIWMDVSNWISEKWDKAMSFVNDMVKWLGDQINIKLDGIGSLFAKLGFGIYYAFQKAVEGVLRLMVGFAAGMYRTISGIGGALSSLMEGDFSGAGAKALGVATGQNFRDGLGAAFSGMKFSWADFDAQYAKVGAGRNVVANWLNEKGAQGRGKPTAAPTRSRAEMDAAQIAALMGEPQGPKPAEETGSRKKGRSLADQREQAENEVDAFMQRLAKRDPVGKLQYDFVKGLTDQGHLLLSDKSYDLFYTNMKTNAGDATKQTEALIQALQTGSLNTRALNDIKARYGEDVDGIIALLRQQLADYEEAIKDATIKGLEQKYKSVADAMGLLGDALPYVQEAKDNLEQLTALGRLAFPPGEGFTKWLTDLHTGAISASEAMDQLTQVMMDPAKRSAGMNTFLSVTGTDAAQVAAAGAGKVAGNDYRRREAEIDLKFGERLLQQRYEEITLMGMSSRQAEVMKTVQDEVRRARQANLVVTNEGIAALTKEVEAQQALAEQMQRNKEFFENNGVRSYINELKTAGEAINELDKTVLQSLEDQLFNLGTTGKFSFNAIFDTIQQGLVRFASQEIMKTLTTSIFGGEQMDGGMPSIFGGLFKMFGAKYEPAQTGKLGTRMNPMYVAFANGGTVDTNGQIFKGGQRQVTVGDSGVPTLEQQFDQTFGTGTTGTPVGATTGTTGALAQTTQAAAQTTATSFKDTMVGMMPMVGMAFASQMKSPIGQIAVMFGSMIMQQLLMSQTAGGGGGGLLGGLLKIGGSLLGGGGGLAADVTKTIAANPGIFKEGGYTGSPVARGSIHPAAFVNAPHYAEGTPNTSGGMPAILHDNEAVIPLSRGRKVAVEMSGNSRGQVINNNFTVNTPDANSFRKSKQQIATDMHMQAGRAYRRNHG